MAHFRVDDLIGFASVVVFLGGVFWLIFQIRYVIDDRHVRVKLGRFTLRKIALTDIEFVDTKAPLWNEHWCNALVNSGRVVRLRRKTGPVRNFIITPKDRDAFIEELRRRLSASTA